MTSLNKFDAPVEAGPAIVFVGNSISFSNDLLRLLSADFQDFQVKRYASLDSFLEGNASRPGSVATLVLEESYADFLAEDPEAPQRIAPGAHVALAYRDREVASRLLHRLVGSSEFDRLCLLPMKVQYDTWRSIVSLVVMGEGYLPRELVRAAMMRNVTPAAAIPSAREERVLRDPTGNLTEREMQVLSLVSSGKQNKVVAFELNLSEHTVKLHMHHIITKLGARNRTEATAWYLSRFGARKDPGTPGWAEPDRIRPN